MKISHADWRLSHFLPSASPSDAYYTKLANKLFDLISFNGIDPRFTALDLREITLSIASYFEDVISDVGLWRTFVTTHKELYGRYLPFYYIDEEEYLLDEINLQDIFFLLWAGAQRHNEDSILNPENPNLIQLATQIYNFLDAEFEKAPINTQLVEGMLKPYWFIDFFNLKEWLNYAYDNLSLLQDPLMFDHELEEEQKLEPIFGDSESMLVYTVSSILTLNAKIGPLALTTPQWMSRLLRLKGMENEAAMLDSIECKPVAVYLIKEYDAEVVTLESIAGDILTLARNSFSELPDETLQTSKLFIASLARSNHSPYWQLCGDSTWMSQSDLFIQSQQDERHSKECSQIMRDKLLAANDNHPLLYFADYQEMKQFIATHIGFADGFVDTEEMKDQTMIVMYIQPDGTLSTVPNKAPCIKDDRNPFYDPKIADKEAMSFIFYFEMTTSEMAHYLVDHNMLPDACLNSLHGPEHGRELVQQNIGFLLRFFRRWEY